MIVHEVRRFTSMMRTFVGPLRLRQDPLGFLLEAAREQAEVAYLGAGPRPIYLINDPALIKYVLHDNRENYRKSPQIKRIKSLFGEGLTTSEGALWQRQRRLILPLFHHKYVTAIAPLITEVTSKRLMQWNNRAEHEPPPMDLTEEMTGLTRDIMVRVLFGSRLSENLIEVTEALKIAVEYVNHRVRAIAGVPQFIPTPRNRLRLKALRVLDTFMQSMIDKHRRSPSSSGGLLGLLAGLRNPQGGELMDDRQLRDEAMTMLVAGHTTAAAGLAWVCVLLAQNPEVEGQLRYELRRALGRRVATADDLSKLVYLKPVIQEALRLFPPTWITARTPLAADRFRGWRIPAHSLLLISPYTMHRCPRFWHEPECFVPERFSKVSAIRDPYTYLPFGRGARMCIGQGLAMMEIQLVLATIVRDHCFRLDPGAAVVPEADLTLRPRGAFVTLHDVM
jgi:cytochrome P450